MYVDQKIFIIIILLPKKKKKCIHYYVAYEFINAKINKKCHIFDENVI